MRIKQRKLNALKSWHEKLMAEHPGLCYKLRELDFEAITKGMTQSQIELVLYMTVCANGMGHENNRKYWAPNYHAMRIAAERATGSKDIQFTGLRLVSGAAHA